MNHEESQIQREIVKKFQEAGIFFHSIPNEAAGRDKIRQALMVALGLRKGVADGIAWLPLSNGVVKVTYIEVKTPKGKQSPQQKAFEYICKFYGVPYMVIRSIEEIDDLIGRIKASKTLYKDYHQIWLEGIKKAEEQEKGKITTLSKEKLK